MEKKRTTQVLQKFINGIGSSHSEEIIRLSKRLKEDVVSLGKLQQKALAKELQLKDSIRLKERIEKSIIHLKEIQSNHEIEIIRLKQQARSLGKKSAALENSLQNNKYINEKDLEIAYKTQIRLHTMQLSTKMYMDETTSANVVRGFFGNDIENKLLPYEIDKNKISEADCSSKIWDSSKKVSPYRAEWKNLFSGE